MKGFLFRLALQAVLAYTSRIDEKGPCGVFPYQGIQAPNVLKKGLNLQFLTCCHRYDRLRSVFAARFAVSRSFLHACTPARLVLKGIKKGLERGFVTQQSMSRNLYILQKIVRMCFVSCSFVSLKLFDVHKFYTLQDWGGFRASRERLPFGAHRSYTYPCKAKLCGVSLLGSAHVLAAHHTKSLAKPCLSLVCPRALHVPLSCAGACAFQALHGGEADACKAARGVYLTLIRIKHTHTMLHLLHVSPVFSKINCILCVKRNILVMEYLTHAIHVETEEIAYVI